jgi:hypothetical protein
MPRILTVLVVCSLQVLAFHCPASAQSSAAIAPPSVSDPQAVSFAAGSMTAMTSGTAIRDVTLTGSVTWNGLDTGTATLKALGMGESRIDLVLTSGTRSEIRDAQTGVPLGQWVTPANASGSFASHNCWTDAAWFFPALGSLSASSKVTLSYIGQESRNGTIVQHIRSYNSQTIQFPTLQSLGTIDFYLDASTLLPVTLTFNTHPDNDAANNLLVEVDLSNYQNVGGVAVPMHIQRRQQGNVLLDIVLDSATFNIGLPLTIFAVN